VPPPGEKKLQPSVLKNRVKDPAVLEQFKAGDMIDFVADRIDGVYTVIQANARR